MKLRRVESSVVGLIGYSEKTSTLRVVFHNGKIYDFYLVPKAVYKDFVSAPSKGAFFDDQIRGANYPFKLVGAERER